MEFKPENKQDIYNKVDNDWALAKDYQIQEKFIKCRKSYKTNKFASKLFPKLKKQFKKDSEKKLNARILKNAISLVDKKNNPELAKEIKKVKLKNWNKDNLTHFKKICTFIHGSSENDEIDEKAQAVTDNLFEALHDKRKKRINQTQLSERLESISQSTTNDEKITNAVNNTFSLTDSSKPSSEHTKATSEVTSEYTDLSTSTYDISTESKTDSNDISTSDVTSTIDDGDDDLSDSFIENLSESSDSTLDDLVSELIGPEEANSTLEEPLDISESIVSPETFEKEETKAKTSPESTDSTLDDLFSELIGPEEANSTLEEPLDISDSIVSPETSEKEETKEKTSPESTDKKTQKSSAISYEGIKELYETPETEKTLLPDDKTDIEPTISSTINEKAESKSPEVLEEIKPSIERLSEEAVEIKGSQAEPVLDKTTTEEQAAVSDIQALKETKITTAQSSSADLFKPSKNFKKSLDSLKKWEMHRSVSPFIKSTTLSSRKEAKLQKLDKAIYRKAKEAALKQDFELSTIKHLKPIFSNISKEIADQLKNVEANEKKLTRSFNKLSALMKALEDYSNNEPMAISNLTTAITNTYPSKTETLMTRSLLFKVYISLDTWNIENIKNDERFDLVEFLVYALENNTDLNGAGTLVREYLEYDLPPTEYHTESAANKTLIDELDVWLPMCQLINKLRLRSSDIFDMKAGYDHAINFLTLNLASEELHFKYFYHIPKAYLDSILFSELSPDETFLQLIKLQALQNRLEQTNSPYLQHPHILLELQDEIMQLLNVGDFYSLDSALTEIDDHLGQVDQWIPTSDYASTDHHINEAISFIKHCFNEAKEITEASKSRRKKRKPRENALVDKFGTLLELNSEKNIYTSFLKEALDKSRIRYNNEKLSAWVDNYIELKENDDSINTDSFESVFNGFISESTKAKKAKHQQKDLAEKKARLLKESKGVFGSDKTIYHNKSSGSNERFEDLLSSIGTAFFSELDNEVYKDLSIKLVNISKHVKSNHKKLPQDQQNQLVHSAFKGFIQQNLMVGKLPISHSDYTAIQGKEATLKAHCDVLAKILPKDIPFDLPATYFDDNNSETLESNLKQALSICPNIKPEQLSEQTAELIVELWDDPYGGQFVSLLNNRADQVTHFRWILDITPPLLDIDESGEIRADNISPHEHIFNFLLSSTKPISNKEIQEVQNQAKKIFTIWAAAKDEFSLSHYSISGALDKSFNDGQIFSEHRTNFKLSKEFIDLFSENLKLNSLQESSSTRCFYIKNHESIKMFLPVIEKIAKSDEFSHQDALKQVDRAIYQLHREYPCTPLSEIMETIANPKLSKIVSDLGSYRGSLSKTLKEFSKQVDLGNKTYKPLLKLYPDKPKFKRSKHNHLNKCISNYMGLLNSTGIHEPLDAPVELLAEYIETSYKEISLSDNYPEWLPFNGYADIVLNTISSRHLLGISNMDELTSHIDDLFNLIGAIEEHQLLDLIATPLSTQLKEDAASLLTPMLLNGLLNPPISTGQPFIIHNLVKLHKKGLNAIPEGLIRSDEEIALVKKLTTQLLSHVSINTNTVHTIAQSSIPFVEANVSEIMGSYKASFMKFVCMNKGIKLPSELASAPDLPPGVTIILERVFKASFASGIISLLRNQVAGIIKLTLTEKIVSRVEEAMPYCSPDTQKEISSFVRSTVESILEESTEFNDVVKNLCDVLAVSKKAEVEKSVDKLLDSTQDLIVSITNSLVDYAIDKPSETKQVSIPEVIEPLSSGLGQVFKPIQFISPDASTTPYENQVNLKEIADHAIRYLTANTIENQLEDLTLHLLQDLGLDPVYEKGIHLLLTYIQDPIYSSPLEPGKQLSILELITLYASDERPIENLEDLFATTPYLKGIGPFLSSALSCITIDGNNLEKDLTEILDTVFELIQTVTIDRYVNSSLFNESSDTKPGSKAEAALEYTSRKCGQILDPKINVKDPLLEQVHDFLITENQEFSMNESFRNFLSGYASKYISQSLLKPYSYLDKQLTNKEKKIKKKFPDNISKWEKALSTNLSKLKSDRDTTKSKTKKKFYNQVISYIVSKQPLPQSILNNLDKQELSIDHLIYFEKKAFLENSQDRPETPLNLNDPILQLIDDYYAKPVDNQEPTSTKLSAFEGFALASQKRELMRYRKELRLKQILENYSNLIEAFALDSIDSLLINLENNPDISNKLLVQFKTVATFFHKKHNLEEPVDDQAFIDALNSLYSMIFDNIKSKGLVPSLSTLISTVLAP